MSTTTADPVLVDRRGDALVVTINRPDARNAVDPDVARGIAAALDRLDDDDSLRVGVLTGAGGSFCAGMDLRHAARTGERPNVPGRGFAGIVERPSRKPLIAAVEGAAVGGGCEIALACDLIVAATSARFGLPEVRVGLVPGGGGMFRLPARIPYHAAMEMVLTGEPVPAPRAHALGLVNRLADDGRALEVALDLARVVAANAPVAVAVATEVVRLAGAVCDEDWWAGQAPFVARVRATHDATEGPRAFAEKRPPQWTGR